MAEYIKLETISCNDLARINTADVIERSKYDELHEKYLKAIHNHTECLKELHEYRSKIAKTIAEIKELYTEWENSTDDARLEFNPFGAVLNIIQRNIGE